MHFDDKAESFTERAKLISKLIDENVLLMEENEKLKKDAKEAVNTTWRFINAYENKNDVPVKLALRTAKYHLKQIDYIFED